MEGHRSRKNDQPLWVPSWSARWWTQKSMVPRLNQFTEYPNGNIYIYMFILYIVYNNNHNDKNHSWNILKYIICHTYTHTVYILHYHYGQFTFLPCYYLKQLWRGGAWYCSCLYTSPKSHLTAKERVECPLRHGKQLIRHGNHQFNGWPNLQCITAITLANILQKGVCESSMTFIS